MEPTTMTGSRWAIRRLFDSPLPGDAVRYVEHSLDMPPEVEAFVRENWDKQLRNKQAQLANVGVRTIIAPYELGGSPAKLNALYEGRILRMWPGPCLTLLDSRASNSTFELHVAPISFPYIAALSDTNLSGAFAHADVQKPTPPLAVCVFVITSDEQLVLTLRGQRTSLYPGTLYGIGGNPVDTQVSPSSYIREEIEEEIHLPSQMLRQADLRWCGLVTNEDLFPGKPDLVGWIPANANAAEIKALVEAVALSDRQNDAVGVVFAPAAEGRLFDFLTLRTHPLQFAPPGLAGLFAYGAVRFGKSWADDLLASLPRD